jgi:hypothetical protein
MRGAGEKLCEELVKIGRSREKSVRVGRVRTSAQPSTIAKVSLQPQAHDEGPLGRRLAR